MCSNVLSSTTLQSWRDRSPSSFSLKIQNFSQFEKSTTSSEENYQSCHFSSGGYKWRMMLYPRGNKNHGGSGFISMYVEKIFTQVNFRLVDPHGSNHLIRNFTHWHNKSNLGWGYPQFTPLAELSKTYLDKKGSLNVEVEFDVVSETKYSPII